MDETLLFHEFVPGAKLTVIHGFSAYTIDDDQKSKQIFLLAHEDRHLVVVRLNKFDIVVKGVHSRHKIPECVIYEENFQHLRKIRE